MQLGEEDTVALWGIDCAIVNQAFYPVRSWWELEYLFHRANLIVIVCAEELSGVNVVVYLKRRYYTYIIHSLVENDIRGFF